MADKSEPDLEEPYQRLKSYWEKTWQMRTDFLDLLIKPHLTLVSASQNSDSPNHATSVFSFTVPPFLCNGNGTVHGGAVAVVFDICTSRTISLSAHAGFWDDGQVSRTLNCTYLRSAPEGSTLLVKSEILHLGNNMGLIRAVMTRENDGVLCFSCEHNTVRFQKRSNTKL